MIGGEILTPKIEPSWPVKVKRIRLVEEDASSDGKHCQTRISPKTVPAATRTWERDSQARCAEYRIDLDGECSVSNTCACGE
jgi:hypothetical protein